MKPYFERNGITIYHGDCREVLPALDAVEMVVTDPPYGMGKASWDVFIAPTVWLPAARRARTVAVFSGVRAMFDYPKPDWTMCWHRPASTQRNGRFRGFNNWEPILVYGGSAIANDVITCPNSQEPAGTGHPTTKPTSLMRQLIARLGDGGVLDPFMGSGTTLRAAMDLGRQAIGIEIEERYCEIAAKRLEQQVLAL